MIQAMRSCHTGLAKNLLVLWLVLFFACSFSHLQPAASGMIGEASASSVTLSLLHSDHDDAQHDQGAADTCSALQNTPLNQQLLMLLALTALLGLAGSLGLLAGLQRRISGLQAPLFGPGLPTPMRKQLHRYNE